MAEIRPIPDALNAQCKPKTNIMLYLLSDTSITKACNDKTKADRLIELVKKKESLLKDQKRVRAITERRRSIQETWEKCVKTEIFTYHTHKANCETAAIKIQKIVRGFLVRIKIDPMLLEQRELRSQAITIELREQTDFCMLTLGSNTIPVTQI